MTLYATIFIRVKIGSRSGRVGSDFNRVGLESGRVGFQIDSGSGRVGFKNKK